jgi:hypothetical protein
VFIPQPIRTLSGRNVVKVACGDTHTLAVTAEGELFSFGRNQNGQLGLGTAQDAILPQPVESLKVGLSFLVHFLVLVLQTLQVLVDAACPACACVQSRRHQIDTRGMMHLAFEYPEALKIMQQCHLRCGHETAFGEPACVCCSPLSP